MWGTRLELPHLVEVSGFEFRCIAHCFGCRVQVVWFGVQGAGCRVLGVGCGVKGLGCGVQRLPLGTFQPGEDVEGYLAHEETPPLRTLQ